MVLLTMDFFLKIFKKQVEKYQHDKYIFIYIDTGQKKLLKYYQKAYQGLGYIAAIVLDPIKK